MCVPGTRLGFALVEWLGASVVLPIRAWAWGAFLVPSDRGGGLRGLGGPPLRAGKLLLKGEFGWGCAGGRDAGGLWWKGRGRHGAGLLRL